MPKDLTKRILTSILLLFLLFFTIFSFFFKIVLFVISFLLFLEFRNIFKKIFKYHSSKNKINIKYFIFNILAFIYLFLIFTLTSIELHDKTGSSILFLFIISICIFSDIGGYVIGKTIGGKKLTKISPNKTISGAIGSFVFSLIPLIIFENVFNYNFELNFNIIIFILIVCLISQFGDLFISYLKRSAKIKDTGSLLPGHGGILDRLDGIIFAIPFSYLLIKFI